jgi:hypothetical protein
MADRDAMRSAVPKKADADVNESAPMTSAPDPGREQGRGDSQGNAVQEAEREQERQLAEGTESPGRGCRCSWICARRTRSGPSMA